MLKLGVMFLLLFSSYYSIADYKRCEAYNGLETYYLNNDTKEIFRTRNYTQPFLTEKCGCTVLCGNTINEDLEWLVNYEYSTPSIIEYSLKNEEHGLRRTGSWSDLGDDMAEISCSELSNPIELSNCTSVVSME